MKKASQLGTQKGGITATPSMMQKFPDNATGRSPAPGGGVIPLSAVLPQGWPSQGPTSPQTGRLCGYLRQQVPSLDGDRICGVPSPQGNDTPVSVFYLISLLSGCSLYVIAQNAAYCCGNAAWVKYPFQWNYQSACSFPGCWSAPAVPLGVPSLHTV